MKNRLIEQLYQSLPSFSQSATVSGHIYGKDTSSSVNIYINNNQQTVKPTNTLLV